MNRPSTSDRIRQAARIASLVVQAEAELEVLRNPRRARRRSCAARSRDPGAARRSRRATRDRSPGRASPRSPSATCVERAIEQRERRRRSRSSATGNCASAIHGAQELGLHLVKQAAARQRIHAHERFGLVPRLAADESSPEGTDTGRRKTAAARTANTDVAPSRFFAMVGAIAGADLDQAVARRPDRAAARPAADHRSPQRVVQTEQIVRVALHRRRIARIEQRLQDGQIVLEIVDGAVGILRRRPGEVRARFVGRIRGEDAMIGHAAGDRAHHVERVKRRHTRARFRHVHARIREIQSLRRRANRDLQQQPLGAAAIVLQQEIGVDIATAIVEQQRIFARTLRDDTLGETGHEHDAERSSASLMRRAHEHASVSARGRIPVERDETIVQNVARLFERHRSHVAHGPQIGKRPQHTVRARQRLAREAPRSAQSTRPRWRAPANRPACRRSAARSGEDASGWRGRARIAGCAPTPARRARARRSASGSPRPVRRAAAATAPCRPARVRPPTTDDSTISSSHFQGERSVPATMASSSESASGGAGTAVSGSSTSLVSRFDRSKTSSRGTMGVLVPIRAARRVESSRGTCPSDRYSSNRLAESPSTPHDSSAMNARPAGSGRRVPRSKYTGTPPRAAACSSSPRYCCGVRRNTAISSNRTPRLRLVQNPPNDFEGFPAFARSRKQRHVARPFAKRWAFVGEDVPPQVGEVRSRLSRVRSNVDRRSHALERGSGPQVAVRNRRQRSRRALDQRLHEFLLSARIDRHVEEDQRKSRPRDASGAPGARRAIEECRAIVDSRSSAFGLDVGQQAFEIADGRMAALVQESNSRAGRIACLRAAGEPQFMNRSRQRFRKTRHLRHRREVRQLARRRRIERGSRGHRFIRRLRAWDPSSLQDLSRRTRSELRQAESKNAERRAEALRHPTREIISRTARCTDDDNF